MTKLTIGVILGSLILVTLLVVGSQTVFKNRSDKGVDQIDYPTIDRAAKLPADITKVTPEQDVLPPKLHSAEFQKPIPLPGPINTAGAEDSPFIAADRDEFYFFFTPDVRIPPERQLNDEVTGIWRSKRVGESWTEPERVWLQEPRKMALDGCPYVAGTTMWFCSTREGYSNIHWFTASFQNGRWSDWHNSDFDPGFKVGELHFSADGQEVYFGSDRAGGKGEHDLYVSRKSGATWPSPEAVAALNTAENELQPFLTADGNELWFTRFYRGAPAVYRSKRVSGTWQSPELIASQFAGEPTLDADGNLYFVHHFYKNNQMIEADIYVAKKRWPFLILNDHSSPSSLGKADKSLTNPLLPFGRRQP